MQTPKAKSATSNTMMGKVKASPFAGASVSTKSTTTKSPLNRKNLPVLILIVGAGTLMILYLRSRKGGSMNSQTPVQSGPLTVLTQSAAPDQSQIDNLTAGILALAGNSQVSTGGQVTNLPSNPGGGTSTPLPNSNGYITPPNSNGYIAPPIVGYNGGFSLDTGGIAFTTAPNLSKAQQDSIDLFVKYGGGSQGLGPNNSLVDWYKYQLSAAEAARNGVIVGESPAFLSSQGNDPVAYLRDTLGGGNPSFYGPNAGVPQKALDAEALAKAKAELGIK